MKRMEYTEEKKAAVEKLIARFVSSGLNFEEVSRGTAITPPGVGKIMNGLATPRWATIDKINRFFNRMEKKNGQDSHNKA